MSIGLRIILFAVSLITAIGVFRKIRKSEFLIGDTLFWIFFTLFVLILSIFPGIATFVAGLLKVESPANIVFLAIIFLLLVKLFDLTVKISKTESRLNNLVQKYALDHKEDIK